MMNDYLIRFSKMVDELKNHPKVQVCHFHTFPPASDEEIAQVENTLGYQLDASIKSFYSQTNGLQLNWIFKNNENYDEQRHYWQEKPLDFDYHLQDYYPEDGSVMIRPIHAFLEDWNDAVYFDFMSDEDRENFMGKEYGLLEFSKKIKPFDVFSKYYDMAFFLDGSSNPPVILGDDHQACYTDSKITNFESYLEFLIANKGISNRRKGYYHQFQGHEDDVLITPQNFWSSGKTINLDTLLLKDIFPLSDQAGSSTASLNTSMMQQMAQGQNPITKRELTSIIKQHHQFLFSGGAGGKWQTVHVSGLVLGIYTGPKHQEGEQAGFERKHVSRKLEFEGVELPFSNFCGCYAKGVDFSDANLSQSLFTDAFLEDCIFADTDLSGVDFSRANLQGANFMNANLKGADLENCNLKNAVFTGANLEGSRFPGACLDNVKT